MGSMQEIFDDLAWAAAAEAEAAGDASQTSCGAAGHAPQTSCGAACHPELGDSLVEMQNEILRIAILNNRLGHAVEALANGADIGVGVEAMTEKVLAFAEEDGLGIAYREAYMSAYGAMVRLGIAAELQALGGELEGDLIDRMVSRSLALEAARIELEAPTAEEVEFACGSPDPVGEIQSVGRIAI